MLSVKTGGQGGRWYYSFGFFLLTKTLSVFFLSSPAADQQAFPGGERTNTLEGKV